MKIETLAIAIQKDFDAVHSEMTEISNEITGIHGEMAAMATKEELRSVESTILLAIQDLRKTTEGIGNNLAAYAERTNEDISQLQSSVKDLDVRLRMIEK